jgi:hypothetical protein
VPSEHLKQPLQLPATPSPARGHVLLPQIVAVKLVLHGQIDWYHKPNVLTAVELHLACIAGDLWYFPPNVPHSIVGLSPAGCTYVTGYNAPDFNELRAFSASSWLATVHVATLAQVRDCSMHSMRHTPEQQVSFCSCSMHMHVAGFHCTVYHWLQ